MKLDKSEIFDSNVMNMGDVSKNSRFIDQKITNMGDVSKNSMSRSKRPKRGAAKSIFNQEETEKGPDPWEPMPIDEYYETTG